MSDDGVLKISTQVDISGIKAGMAEAAATVKASTSQMDAAYKDLANATVAYTDQQKALRDTIKLLAGAEAERAVAIKILPGVLAENVTATKALQSAKAALTQQERDAKKAAEEEALALKAQNAALLENALAQTAAATASGAFAASQGEATAAARLAGRELGGSVGGQLGMIAARSSVLGPILSSPFLMAAPIIAGVALVIYQVGEKIYEMRKQAEEAADNIDISFRRMADGIRSSNDSLLTENDRLVQEIDNLLKRPTENGLVIAFDEAAAAADKLSVSIDADIDKMRQLVDAGNQKNSIGFWQGLFSGKAQTGGSQKLIQDQLRDIQAVNDEYSGVVQRAADSGNKANLAQAQERQLVALQNAYKSATDKITESLKTIVREQDVYEESGKTFGKDQTANINMLRGALQGLADEQRNVGERYRNENLQQQLTPLREQHTELGDQQSAARKAAEAQRKVEEAAIQAARETLESMKAAHTMTAIEESQYWAGLASVAQAGSKSYATYLMEANRATARAQQEGARALKQWGEEAEEQFAEQIRASDQLAKNQEALANAVQQSSDRIAEAHSKAAQTIDESTLRATEAAGGFTKLAAAQEQARIHAEAYREELKRLDDEITRVNSDMALTPEQRTSQNGQLQAQKVQLQGQAQAAAITDQANIQQQIANPYLQAFNQIDQAWLQVQNRMFYSTRNLSLEFAKMGQSILISVVDSLEKAALVTLQKEAVMVIAHSVANQQKLASDAQTAAASDAISNTSLLKKIALELIGLFRHTATNVAKTTSDTSAAAVQISTATATAAAIAATKGVAIAGNAAAAQSFAGLAAVEAAAEAAPGGPGAAIVAGAEMYAALSPFVAMASFAVGTGYVPRDGMAYLHEGEAVVPAPTMEELRGGDGGGDITINHTANIHAPTEQAILNAIRKNPQEIAGALRRHMRQAGRA